jgi:lysozyme family protein
MTLHNFEICTSWVLVHEGSFVNHPRDPGGATNLGITQRVYDGYRDSLNKELQSVRKILDEEVLSIYRNQYWNQVWGDKLPCGIDYALYDFAINSGPKRAIQFIQRILKIKDDGVMGNVTLGAIVRRNDIEGLIQALCQARWDWMKKLKTFSTFGRGWTRRVMGNTIEGIQIDDDGVIDRSVLLFRESRSISFPKAIDDGANQRADEDDLKVTEKIKTEVNLGTTAKIVAGSIPGAITASASLPEGPLQYAAAIISVLATVFVLLILYKRFSK